MKKIPLLTLVLVCALRLSAQDTHFSQFYLSPSILNPASAGTHYSGDATLVHRNQWSSFTSPFKTSSASGSVRINEPTRLRRGFWAAGAFFINDQSGDGSLRINSMSINLVHHVNITRNHRLGLGLQPGMMSRKISAQNFQWASQYNGAYYDAQINPGESPIELSRSFFDLNAGLVFSFQNNANKLNVLGNSIKQGTIGLSLHHLNRPRYSFMDGEERLKVKTVFYYHALYTLGSAGFGILPNVLWMRQGGHRELSIGAMGMYQMNMESKFTKVRHYLSFYFGTQYRAGDALILNTMLEYANYMLGFCYDINFSQLNASTLGRGGFEISLKVTSRPHDKMSIIAK